MASESKSQPLKSSQSLTYSILKVSPVSWITLRTTRHRWEAELMLQLLAAHDIPARLVDLGIASCLGAGSPAALQVHAQNQWTALLLLSPIEEDSGRSDR